MLKDYENYIQQLKKQKVSSDTKAKILLRIIPEATEALESCKHHEKITARISNKFNKIRSFDRSSLCFEPYGYGSYSAFKIKLNFWTEENGYEDIYYIVKNISEAISELTNAIDRFKIELDTDLDLSKTIDFLEKVSNLCDGNKDFEYLVTSKNWRF